MKWQQGPAELLFSPIDGCAFILTWAVLGRGAQPFTSRSRFTVSLPEIRSRRENNRQYALPIPCSAA
jgi:hypothetical protein